jgi:NADH-quinone oxidoreductase subunit L
MRITAITMLVGMLTIAGIPLFAGWYSKDAILAQAMGYVVVHREHLLLFLLPLVTAGITTFYMARMWFMTFTGPPRDPHVYEHAHESPWTMTVPLIVLAVCSMAVAWGTPIYDAKKSALEHQIHHAQHPSILADFGHITKEPYNEIWPSELAAPDKVNVRHHADRLHDVAGYLALLMVAIGLIFSSLLYYNRALDPAEAKGQVPRLHAFLWHKWYFDELYSAVVVRPALVVAACFRAFDLVVIDGIIHGVARFTVRLSRWDGVFDNYVVDGLVNLVGNVFLSVGAWLRGFQTGYLRNYILFLVLAAIGIFLVLSYFVTMASAG